MNREEFKKALENTTRAVSGNPELRIYFGQSPALKADTVVLPDVPEKLLNKQMGVLRAQADRVAFMRRYGGEMPMMQWLGKLSPQARQVVTMMEVARTEAVGTKDFPGTLPDIRNYGKREASRLSHGDDELVSNVFATSLLLRESLGLKLGKVFTQETKQTLSRELAAWVQEFSEQLNDVEGRIGAYEALLGLLDLDYDTPDVDDDQAPGGDTDEQQSAENNENDGSAEESSMTMELEAADAGASESSAEEDDTAMAMAEAPAAGAQPGEGEFSSPYKIFTTSYDKVLPARRLFPEGEVTILDERFRAVTANNRRVVRRLSSKLQRYLLAQQPFGWKFDQEEGVIDPAKLALYVANESPYLYRRTRDRRSLDTLVTLLVDNSGSMRGRPIEMAAISMDVLARTLEQCGVTSEVLGFTTLAWKGGRSRMEWINADRPDSPGRLNDLLHVIYKPAEKSYRSCRRNFPVMLADDLLKENIDGESLKWAYQRMVRRPEKRKILIVISDGAPVDYATDRHNSPGYLDRHLRGVIGDIEQNRKVQLLAIGIGHDVSRYYKNAVSIEDPDELGPALVDRLLELFKTMR